MTDNIETDSFDTNTTDNSPMNLLKLPVVFLENLPSQLPLIDCLTLRRVCRDLRNLVDSSKVQCQTVKLSFGDKWAEMILDGLRVQYTKNTNSRGCVVTSEEKKTYRNNRNFQKALLSDAAVFLKNPKLEVDHLQFQVRRESVPPRLTSFLNFLKFRLNVRSIQCNNLRFLQSVQEFLKPDKLKEILFNGINSGNEFNSIPETNFDILKNPKLKFESLMFYDYSDAMAAKFAEIIKSVDAQFSIQSITIDDGRWIRSILHSLNPEKVDHIVITNRFELTVDILNEFKGMHQWKAKTRLNWCSYQEEVGLEHLVGFKQIRSIHFELTEENLIKIRDDLVKSRHLETLHLTRFGQFVDDGNDMNEMTIQRIMGEDPAYDASSRRFSIPNSHDYFQLDFERSDTSMTLNINRVSVE